MKPYVLPQKCIRVNYVIIEWLTHADLDIIGRFVLTAMLYMEALCVSFVQRDGCSTLPFVIIASFCKAPCMAFIARRYILSVFFTNNPFCCTIHTMPPHDIFKINFYLSFC